MNLPSIVRTKAEAETLAADIVPTNAAALAALLSTAPGAKHPRYQLDFTNAHRLQEVFEWLTSKRTRIARGARWTLFYYLAQRTVREVDENGQAKVREIYAPSAARTFNTYAMGDGDGI